MPDSIGNRIRLIREELNMNAVEFAKKAGISNSIIYQVEEGTAGIGLASLVSLSGTFGISLNWLALGIGPRYLKDTQMPFRGDALDLLKTQCRIEEAPGLAELLSNKDVCDKLRITSEEIQILASSIKGEHAWIFDGFTAEQWLDILVKHRKMKLDVVQHCLDLLARAKSGDSI